MCYKFSRLDFDGYCEDISCLFRWRNEGIITEEKRERYQKSFKSDKNIDSQQRIEYLLTYKTSL